MKILTQDEILKNLAQKKYPAQSSYLLAYSSWLGGFIDQPSWMLVPMDDHLVHRGDGVFEAIKVVQGKMYLSDPHLDRLQMSAEKIGMQLPISKQEFKNLIQQGIDGMKSLGKSLDFLVRLYVSRGPGGFTTNPYESVGAQIYFAFTKLAPPSAQKYQEGVSVGPSKIPLKGFGFETIKSCNYLHNVLMKKEAVDQGFDFTVSWTDEGYLAESSTENIFFVDQQGYLCFPFWNYILKGTTMVRSAELAEQKLVPGLLKGIRQAHLSLHELKTAREVMMVGTTLDVLPVTSYQGEPIADGKVGPVARALLKLIQEDQLA